MLPKHQHFVHPRPAPFRSSAAKHPWRWLTRAPFRHPPPYWYPPWFA